MAYKDKKRFSMILTAITTLTVSGINATVEIDPMKIHIPTGFDSNDDAEVVITGELPDTCYRRPTGETTVTGKEIQINLKASRITGKDVVCIQAIVPYMISVPLGQLSEGYYTVQVNPGRVSEKTSNLFIGAPDSNSIDNFTYANVTNIKKADGQASIYLEGAHPSSCMELESVEMIPNAGGDTISVLPIMKQVSDPCDRMVKPFTYEIPVPTAWTASGTVFHVRSIDGRARNFKW